MSREVKNLNDFSGGLNSASDPKDLDDNQFSAVENLDSSTSGQIKVLGNPTDETEYKSLSSSLISGKGLFSYNSPYAVVNILSNGSNGLSLSVSNTTEPLNGVKASSVINPDFSINELIMGTPVGLSAFAYDSTNVKQTITNGCTAVKSTGVLVNEASGYSIGATDITVDTVDATTKFEAGDMILDGSGNEVGTIVSLSNTSIKINNKNISNDESLSEGFQEGILKELANDEELYNSRAIATSVDTSGATLLVPGQQVYGLNVSTDTFITKVQRARLEVNGTFDSAITMGTDNAEWQDEDQDSAFNSQVVQDTGSNGFKGANSMKYTLDSINTVAWYKMTNCIVGKTYNASIRVNKGDSQSITSAKIGANASTFSAAAAVTDSNFSFLGDNCSPVEFSNRAVASSIQVNFVPTNTTYYIGIYVNGVSGHHLFFDDFYIQSECFVDRIELSHPVTSAFSNQTLNFDKVLFYNLCIYDGMSMNSKKNWIGATQLINQNVGISGSQSAMINTEIVEGVSDYPTMTAQIVNLINGTDEVLPTSYAESKNHTYGQTPIWTSTSNLAWFGKKGNISSTHEAIDQTDGSFVLKGKATGDTNNSYIRFSTYWNPIRYNGIIFSQHTNATVPTEISNVSDYRQYHKPSGASLWQTNFDTDGVNWVWNKNIPTSKNTGNSQDGYQTFGLKWNISGNNANFNEARQWSKSRMDNGVTTSTQVTTLTPSGSVEAGDKLTVVVNDDPSAKKVEVTADGSPTVAEMMTSSSGGLANLMAADAQIDALMTVSYNGTGDIVTLTSKVAGAAGAFDISWSVVGTKTEYKDDKFLLLLDSLGKLKWNSSESGYHWIHHPSINETALWTNLTNMLPVFYADGGKVRIADGNFENNNINKAFRYISRSGLFPGTGGGAGLALEAWHLWSQRIKWNYTEGGGKGLRVYAHTATAPSDATMDMKIEVNSGSVTDMDSDSTTSNFEAPAGHGLIIGDQIDITGSTSLDGRYTISNVSTNEIYFLHGIDTTDGDPDDNQSGTYFKVGTWEENYKFYASAYDMDDNETLPEHIFEHDANGNDISKILSLSGRQLKFTIQCDPGAMSSEGAFIADYVTKGFRIYMSKSVDGYGEKWKLFDIDFEQGVIRADNELITGWTQSADSGDNAAVVEILGGISISDPTELQTYETHNGFSSNNTSLEARYKTITVSGRRAFLGNVYYGGVQYNDRMIVSPYNMLDVFPTPYGILEVTANDGQSIKVLRAYGDNLLQYKSAYLYIINIGSGDPSTYSIVASHRYYGCEDENHVVETPIGIIWANQSSVYLFDGDPDSIVDLFKFSPKDKLGDTQKGVTGEDRTTRKINISEWESFFNVNMIVGFDPGARVVIFKRSSLSGAYTTGDCYIYNIDNDTWTFAKHKWSAQIISTNFVTDLNDSVINIVQTSIGQNHDDGGDIDFNNHGETN